MCCLQKIFSLVCIKVKLTRFIWIQVQILVLQKKHFDAYIIPHSIITITAAFSNTEPSKIHSITVCCSQLHSLNAFLKKKTFINLIT